jgi:hypothetical protein
MSDSELWSVALAADNIRSMTLDQLDGAFQRGIVTENTLVWTEGMDSWLRLSDVLGEDEAAAPAPSYPPAAVAHSYPPRAAQSFPPAAAQSFPPAALPSVPPRSAPASLAPMSTSPVELSLGAADLDWDGFPKKGKAKWGVLAAAAVALAGVGITVANMSSRGGDLDPTAAAAAAKPLSAADQPLPVAKGNSPEAPLAGGGYQITAAEDKKFKQEETRDSELRERMSDAVKNQEAEAKAKPRSVGARRAPSRSKNTSTTGVQKGGAKFDPLNGALP